MKNIVIIHTPENVRIPFETAGLGTRGLAKVIDLLCIFILMTPLGMIFPLLVEIIFPSDHGSLLKAGMIVISAAIPLGYFVCLEYWMKGQTLGKRLMKIRVIDEHGGQPGFFAVFLRNALLIADFFPFLFLVGIASIFLNFREKRVGDMTAGTLVVMENKEPDELFFRHAAPNLTRKERDILNQVPVLSGHRFMLLQSFLIRRTELDPAAREQLVRDMLETWWPEIETKPGHEEAFLEKVYLYLREQAYPAQLPHIRFVPMEMTR